MTGAEEADMEELALPTADAPAATFTPIAPVAQVPVSDLLCHSPFLMPIPEVAFPPIDHAVTPPLPCDMPPMPPVVPVAVAPLALRLLPCRLALPRPVPVTPPAITPFMAAPDVMPPMAGRSPFCRRPRTRRMACRCFRCEHLRVHIAKKREKPSTLSPRLCTFCDPRVIHGQQAADGGPVFWPPDMQLPP